MAVSAAASVAGGVAAKQQAGAEAKQYEQNSKYAMIAADQETVQRMEDLNSTLSAIDAIRTARGLDVGSPTGQALRDKVSYDASRAINTTRLNALNQAQGNYAQAGVARSQGQAALLGGFLKAGGTIAKGPGGGGWNFSSSGSGGSAAAGVG
jgi:hypothetical protein